MDGRYWLLQDVLRGSPDSVRVEQNFQFAENAQITTDAGTATARAANGTALVITPIDHTLQPTVAKGDRGPHTSYWPDGAPSDVDASQARKPPIHGRV